MAYVCFKNKLQNETFSVLNFYFKAVLSTRVLHSALKSSVNIISNVYVNRM